MATRNASTKANIKKENSVYYGKKNEKHNSVFINSELACKEGITN